MRQCFIDLVDNAQLSEVLQEIAWRQFGLSYSSLKLDIQPGIQVNFIHFLVCSGVKWMSFLLNTRVEQNDTISLMFRFSFTPINQIVLHIESFNEQRCGKNQRIPQTTGWYGTAAAPTGQKTVNYSRSCAKRPRSDSTASSNSKIVFTGSSNRFHFKSSRHSTIRQHGVDRRGCSVTQRIDGIFRPLCEIDHANVVSATKIMKILFLSAVS